MGRRSLTGLTLSYSEGGAHSLVKCGPLTCRSVLMVCRVTCRENWWRLVSGTLLGTTTFSALLIACNVIPKVHN